MQCPVCIPEFACCKNETVTLSSVTVGGGKGGAGLDVKGGMKGGIKAEVELEAPKMEVEVEAPKVEIEAPKVEVEAKAKVGTKI